MDPSPLLTAPLTPPGLTSPRTPAETFQRFPLRIPIALPPPLQMFGGMRSPRTPQELLRAQPRTQTCIASASLQYEPRTPIAHRPSAHRSDMFTNREDTCWHATAYATASVASDLSTRDTSWPATNDTTRVSGSVARIPATRVAEWWSRVLVPYKLKPPIPPELERAAAIAIAIPATYVAVADVDHNHGLRYRQAACP